MTATTVGCREIGADTPEAPAPTRRPRQPHREAPELAAFLRRMARALVRRAATGDTLALEALMVSREAIDEAIGQAARELHAHGYSWGEIGREVGMTRQAARQRFGR